MVDLDQSGHGFQRVRTYLGPSLGWKDELVSPSTDITTGGIHVVQPGESLLLVDVSAVVQINLPDVARWFQQTADQPATGFERSITVKDIGGNAANFNIAVVPFGQQAIDNIQQALVISQAKANVKLIPLVDLSGWMVETAIGAGGGGGGGGDVFKAGNNTFTGANDFIGPVIVPNQILGDNSTKAANTSFVQGQGFITGAALAAYAPLLNPVFTGDPQAPTPGPSDNDTSIATTAFVQTALAGFSGGAPISAQYIVGALDGILTNERLLTDSASVAWDLTVPGVVKANTVAGGGNVSNSGTPTINQIAQWVTSTTIKGIDISALGFQPLDGDLTAIAALTGTNTIYYRSATDIWSPVTFSGLSFSGGVLTVTAGGGNVSNSGVPTVGQIAVWTDATHIQGITAAYAPIANPVFTGDPQAPTPATADNDTSIATTAFVKAQAYAPLASPVFTGDPRAPTPATSDNDTSVATTAFVKAAIAGGASAQIGFRTRPAGDQNIGHNTAIKIGFTSEVYDQGSFYDAPTSRWTPPAGVVHLDAALYFSANLDTGSAGYVAVYIYKNGISLVSGQTYPVTAAEGVRVSADDVANGTDYYECWGFAYASVGGGQLSGGGCLFNGHVTGGPKGDAGTAGAPGTPGATGASGSSLASPTWPQGRLTLANSTPIMLANVTAASTILYTAYVGDRIPIYDGTSITMMGFSNLTSANLSDTTRSPSAIGGNKVNDWFVWNDAGTLRLIHGPDWATNVTRSVGTALIRGPGGIWYNNVAITGSLSGPAAQRATYVGTTWSNAGSTFDWIYGANRTAAVFSVWNCYNRVRIVTSVTDDTGSWSYSGTTYRIRNGANTSTAHVDVVIGLQEDGIDAESLGHGLSDGSGNIPCNGVSLNAVTSIVGKQAQSPAGTSNSGYVAATWKGTLIGFNVLYATEAANNSGSPSWYGFQAGPPIRTMAILNVAVFM